MSIQSINIGSVANDGTGDPLRTAFGKTNDNFSELASNVSSLNSSVVSLNASVNLVNSNAVVLASNVSSLTASVSNILTGTTSFSGNKTFTDNIGIGTSPSAKLDIAETWNNVSTTFTAIRSNVTDISSAAGSLLLDLQVGGASKFRVGKDGQVSAGSFMMGSSPESTTSMSGLLRNGNNLLVNTVGTQAFNFSTAQFISTRPIAFGASAYAADVVLNRDAADTLAQRNGVNPQTSRIYNTYTDASNYERAKVGWNTNVLEIGTENAGTGTLRNIKLIGGNVGIGITPAAKLDVAGDIRVNSSVTLSSEAATLATITKTQIASFPVASFRSGKLLVQAYDTVTGATQISEILLAHNVNSASHTEYGIVFTGATSIVAYDVDIASANVRLMATRTTTNSTQYKISETLIVS